VVTIAAHFKNAYQDEARSLAIVDGIWQISDTTTNLQEGISYGKMTITLVTADSITMENRDNPIDLMPRSDIELMPSIHIKTANNDTLRYCIYRTEIVGRNSALNS
jgi:hypothetical protein